MAIYCSGLQNTQETESNGTQVGPSRKKKQINTLKDTGRLNVKTAQGLKKRESQ